MKRTRSPDSSTLARPGAMAVAAWLFGSLAAEALAAQDGTGSTAEPGTGMPVMVAQAIPACFSSIVHATGFLVPRAEALVGLTLDGFAVAEILVGEGDIVGEKQPMARLVRIGGPAPAAPPNGAGAASGAAPASILLRAPAAGKVVLSTAAIGATASARGMPLFRIAIDGLIEADAEISSIYLNRIKENQTVRIEPERGREISGRVRKTASEIDPVTQMGHVRVAIDSDDALRAGRFVRATIDTGESCGISVPRSAVLYSTDGTSVQVLRGNLIETVRVRVGIASEDSLEIQAGLRDGDIVVAHAGTSLRDGDRVAPVFIEGAAQPMERR